MSLNLGHLTDGYSAEAIDDFEFSMFRAFSFLDQVLATCEDDISMEKKSPNFTRKLDKRKKARVRAGINAAKQAYAKTKSTTIANLVNTISSMRSFVETVKQNLQKNKDGLNKVFSSASGGASHEAMQKKNDLVKTATALAVWALKVVNAAKHDRLNLHDIPSFNPNKQESQYAINHATQYADGMVYLVILIQEELLRVEQFLQRTEGHDENAIKRALMRYSNAAKVKTSATPDMEPSTYILTMVKDIKSFMNKIAQWMRVAMSLSRQAKSGLLGSLTSDGVKPFTHRYRFDKNVSKAFIEFTKREWGGKVGSPLHIQGVWIMSETLGGGSIAGSLSNPKKFSHTGYVMVDAKEVAHLGRTAIIHALVHELTHQSDKEHQKLVKRHGKLVRENVRQQVKNRKEYEDNYDTHPVEAVANRNAARFVRELIDGKISQSNPIIRWADDLVRLVRKKLEKAGYKPNDMTNTDRQVRGAATTASWKTY